MSSDRISAAPGDAELVQQVLSGQTAAFDILVERHQRRAVSVAYRLLGNLHDALEVCQDAFIRAYRGLHALETPARFGSWLLKIVTNLSLNYRRARKSAGPRLSLEDCIRDEGHATSERVASPPGRNDHPGAALAEEELQAALERALQELPAQQRTALVLFSIEQMPQKDVAEIMGLSVVAVKWHVFQARRKLRARLAEFLEDST